MVKQSKMAMTETKAKEKIFYIHKIMKSTDLNQSPGLTHKLEIIPISIIFQEKVNLILENFISLACKKILQVFSVHHSDE